MMCPLFVSTRLIHKESREQLVKFVFLLLSGILFFKRQEVSGRQCL